MALRKPLIALSAFALLLGGCQTQDGVTGSDRDKNALATGLATPSIPKFADGLVSSGFITPMAMEFSPDGRLFVLEKGGAVKISQGPADPLTFLTLNVDQNTERGLLGIAFDPNWATNKFVYIHYSVAGQNRNRVSRFKVSTTDPNKADPAETILFDLSPLTNSAFHNGGGLHFKDTLLYLTTGDNRLPANAQDPNNLLGKILRFERGYSGTPGLPRIPSTNPFYTNPTNVNGTIWGLGLRNPFTFAVQPGTGRIYINDVGEDGYEEINDATQGGRNFGWPISEGLTPAGGVTLPIGGYANGSGVNAADCAIIGAAFYNPSAGNQQFPAEFLGDYFYGDHCSRDIRTIDPAAPGIVTTFATNLGDNLMDLKVGPDGALYYLTLNGVVGKISYSGSDAPAITRQPVPTTTSVNHPATFVVEAIGGGLSYQWQKNGVNVGNETSYTLPNAQLSDNGAQIKVLVSNAFGTLSSNTVTLTVTSNQPPAPVITSPAQGFTTNAGVNVTFTGSATDPEDGVLAASAFTWSVDLVHDAHTHPIKTVTGAKTGDFDITAVNETAEGISYRITLKVTDATGLSSTTDRIVNLNKVSVTINTSPQGLQFKLDGQPKTSPLTFTGVVGVQRQLEAVSPQTLNGATYTFSSWSHGQPQSHVISTPTTQTTYTANFTTGSGRIALPARIQAEDYKNGGSGVGYQDADAGNAGGQYRPADGVDIEACTDLGAGFNVGWTAAGEWLAYDVSVATAGTFRLTMRMASGVAGTKTASVMVDNNPAIAFNFTDATGWQMWKDVVVNDVNLAAGNHTIRITMTTGNFNLNYLDVVSTISTNQPPIANAGTDKSAAVNTLISLDGRASSDPDGAPAPLTYSWAQISGTAVSLANANTSQPSFTPSAAGTYVFRLTVNDGAATATDDVQATVTGGITYINLPGRLQAEDYKAGGQGIGYNDLTAGNTGGVYRTDNVDIQATTDLGGGYNIGWTDAGEWLAYDVNVATTGTYTFTARLASGNTGTKTLSLSVDGGTAIPFVFSDASGWQSWKDVIVSGVNLTAGIHVLRFTLPNGGMNFNYADVAAGGTANLLLNGDFSNGLVNWQTYLAPPATGTFGNEAGSARVSITNQGVNPYDIQVYQTTALTAGKVYTLDFDIKSETTPKSFRVVVEHNGDPWTKYYDVAYTVTSAANAYQHFTISWTQPAADAGGRVVFDFGATNESDVWLDNVVLK